jgi:hypothetical protein
MMKFQQRSSALTPFLIGGAAIGLLGVAAFGLVHAVVIVPIWTRLSGGIPFGVVSGVAMGWALYELQAAGRLGVGFLPGLAFGSLLWLALLPMTLFGVIVRATGIHGADDTWEVVLEVLLAFGTGAATGRLIGGRWRTTLAFGAASLSLALAQAGPIPVTNSGRAVRLFAALAVVYLLCGMALGFVASMIAKHFRSLSMLFFLTLISSHALPGQGVTVSSGLDKALRRD